MLNKVTFVPVTKESTPFAAAAEICDFESIGYVEEEYFLTGTANIYSDGEKHRPKVLYTGAPYTTRIIVRRPKDAARFSGNVVLEILNATAMFDIDRMWVDSWNFFTRNGDIYIGITSKGHVVDNLLKWDRERYAPINWNNPHPERPVPEWAQTSGPLGVLPQFETGLFWDMLTDCAELLRSEREDNPLKGFGKFWLYLTGWSQSGFYLSRYITSFHDPKAPLFDGFLSAGSGAGLVPLNTYEPQGNVFGNPVTPFGSMMGTAQPTIAVNTESENRIVNWLGDFDEPGYKFRTYQIPGSSHDSQYCILDYFGEKGLADMARIGLDNTFKAVDGDLLDFPYHLIFNAAFYHLYNWVREGIPAPHAPKIETYMAFEESTDGFGSYLENRTDTFGNCIGGIRSPGIDYPTGRYSSFSTDKDGRVSPTFGKVNKFSPEKLRALYGSLDNYRTLVEKGADETVAKGFLLPEDKDIMVDILVSQAANRGLE